MDQFERDEKIYVLWKNGATFTEIVKMFGVSAERTRQIYLREKIEKKTLIRGHLLKNYSQVVPRKY